MKAGAELSPESLPQHYVDTPRFEVEFDYFWSQLAHGMEQLAPAPKLNEMHDEAYMKEINFYFKVYDGVSKVMRASKGEVVCLFDVDGTIAEVKDENKPTIHMLLRPTFPAAISQLAVENPEILRFGLISLRPLDSLREEAESPTFLGIARAYLDDNLLYSSAYTTKTDELMAEHTEPTVISQFLNDMTGFLDEQLIADTRTGRIDFYDWYDPKLKIMAELHRQHPDVTYIFVDNRPYVDYFNPSNSQLVGICVQDEEQLLIG